MQDQNAELNSHESQHLNSHINSDNEIKTPGSMKRKKSQPGSKNKSKKLGKSNAAMVSQIATGATIMGGEEVEEHNEAMNLIDCPHKV